MQALKLQMTHAPILLLFDFAQVFEVEFDAINVGIEVVISQNL